MSKLDLNKKKKREALLNTAFELFTKKGFSSTSISEIAEKAGVAKGTFYLYFKDKFGLKDKLTAYKSKQIFKIALDELDKQEDLEYKERIIFVVDNIIDQLCKDTSLLKFISKNLSWGIFKNALSSSEEDDDNAFANVYNRIIKDSPKQLRDPEIMLYMIVELVNSTIYSSLLFGEPADINTLKPYIYSTIRFIINDHETE